MTFRSGLVAAALLTAATVLVSAAVPPALLGSLDGRQVFPASNWWNLDVSRAPVDPSSAAYVNFISGRVGSNTTATRRVHPDFGPPPYGIPYVVVSGDQPLVRPVWTAYGDESDDGAAGRPAGYPIPVEAQTQPNYIEGAVPGGGTDGDRHLLIVDRDNWLLYETAATRWNAALSRWEADCGAIFSLARSDRRPETWTSADAAGLAIFPGLVRYDEAYGTAEIAHAFRVTVRATNGYVWPASHRAGSTAGALPMGARLRLKASKDLSGYPAPVQRIFRAMQRYGLIVADNGSDMYVSGTMDARWNNAVLNPAFHGLTADDFDVLQLGWRGNLPSAPLNLRVIR
ncbi:MAG TPA: hypothetical protein VFK57_01865 [Vicinamibacterales bacterium]|nr:hypothetical protein [Vicinamibacterales bacterium]